MAAQGRLQFTQLAAIKGYSQDLVCGPDVEPRIEVSDTADEFLNKSMNILGLDGERDLILDWVPG